MQNRNNLPVIQAMLPERKTYRWRGNVITPAANCTDLLTLSGAAGYTIRLTEIHIQCSSTAAAIVQTALLRRSALNTGGTITALNSSVDTAMNGDSAPVATLNQYTANPTGLGSGITNIHGGGLYSPAIATPSFNESRIWDFSPIASAPPAIVNNANMLFAINLGGVALPAGLTMGIFLEWTEDLN